MGRPNETGWCYLNDVERLVRRIGQKKSVRTSRPLAGLAWTTPLYASVSQTPAQ
jgi:hypothetical protein